MTPEQKQLEQIRERQRQRRLNNFHYDVAVAVRDIDFLLSLVKSQEAPPALPVQPQIIRSDADVRQLFDAWWRVNHPFSWWAEERGGQPLPEPDRQMVRDLSERAFYAAEVLSLNAATSTRSACVEKVKELMEHEAVNSDRRSAMIDVISELESLSIEKPKE